MSDSIVVGSSVQVGTISGDVNVRTGQPIRSRYRKQVERIAPNQLVGRETELADLAAFCTAGENGYLWWRAPAWAGKSALLSWFVLNPPPGIRMVSFFITARFSDQNHRSAFIEAVLEQLAAMLEEPLPSLPSMSEVHLLGMLEEAAALCFDRGERLVLVVDGLDEDRGVTTDPDDHSIAGLLPARLPPGLKVVVAGRLNPPVPSDVPDEHPLRDSSIVRVLHVSETAKTIRVEMERELRRLLAIERDMVGLLTAAVGGLTAADLAVLTNRPEWQVREQLETVTGRSLTPRPSHWRPDDTYVLGHEELHAAALHRLSDSLPDYRRRLHAWADDFRCRGWPADTPEYLLRGYFRLLILDGDLDRLVDFVADHRRIDRMQEVSGTDQAALAELVSSQEQVLAAAIPNPAAMARLAMNRQRIADRNAAVPTGLPAVWARLGQWPRAEALADSITYPVDRVDALAALARIAAESGANDSAEALFARASYTARLLTEPADQRRAAAAKARTAAALGDLELAAKLLTETPGGPQLSEAAAEIGAVLERDWGAHRTDGVIKSITYRPTALRLMLGAAEATTDSSRARRLLDVIAGPAFDPFQREGQDIARHWSRAYAALAGAGEVLIAARGLSGLSRTLVLAELAALTDDLDSAFALADELDPAWRASFLQAVCGMRAWNDDQAARLMSALDANYRLDALHEWTTALIKTGDVERLIRMATESGDRRTIVAVAEFAAARDATEHALALVARMTDVLRADSDPATPTYGAAVVALAAVNTDDTALVDDLLAWCETSPYRDEVCELLAETTARRGNFARAFDIAHRDDRALLGIARAAAARWDLATAMRAVHDIRDAHIRDDALIPVAQTLAKSGDLDEARDLILSGRSQWRSMPEVVQVTSTLHQAEILVAAAPREHLREMQLALVRAAEAAGDLSRAARFASQISPAYERVSALLTVAVSAARVGDISRLDALVMEIDVFLNLPAWSDQQWVARFRSVNDVLGHLAVESDPATAAMAVHDPDWRIRLAVLLAQRGADDLAAHLVSTIPLEYERGRGWRALALCTAMGATGRPVVELLRVLHWTDAVSVLAKLYPEVLRSVAAELCSWRDERCSTT
jgi:hypothetical protein